MECEKQSVPVRISSSVNNHEIVQIGLVLSCACLKDKTVAGFR